MTQPSISVPQDNVTKAKTIIEGVTVSVLLYTSLYLWKFHSLLFTKPGSLLLPPPLFSKPVAPPPTHPCTTQNTLINMKEATN